MNNLKTIFTAEEALRLLRVIIQDGNLFYVDLPEGISKEGNNIIDCQSRACFFHEQRISYAAKALLTGKLSKKVLDLTERGFTQNCTPKE